MSNIKVAIRIRPMCHREVNLKNIVSITPDKKISVINAKVPENNAGDSRERVKQFSFDYCFGETSTQYEIFEQLGDSIIQSLISKYNVCVLAYGQSATGKTYTMMGNDNDPGLTPRLCHQLFKTIERSVKESFKVSVSFLEIYNERVQDLLCDHNKIGKLLRVREHPKKGPYVEGLRELPVNNVEELLHWIKSGESLRRVASTLSNKCSSRSHSVLTISCRSSTNTTLNNSHQYSNRHQTLSQIHLVDLAGSERASSVQNSTCRLKEGANINRSLVALGNVISALADNTSGTGHGSRFVPYRDSILTWLLKETLGGNSNTFMIATISPSSSCYSETVNTLRFGQRAKHIVNEPLINEDPTTRIIRELREEIAYLKSLLLNQNQDVVTNMGSILQQIKPQRNNQPEPPTNTTESTNDNLETGQQQEVPNSTNTLSVPSTTKTQPNVPPTKINPPNNINLKPTENNLRRTYSAAEIQRKQDVKFANRYISHETLTENIQQGENPQPKTTHETQIQSESGSQTSLIDSTAKTNAIKNAIKKHKQNKRSEIIASATERLYTQGVQKYNNSRSSSSSVMSDLSANARNRLQEISFKALNASRRAKRQQVHIGIQTNLLKTIRVKEIGIDTQTDINTVLQLTKDVSIETALTNVKHSIAVGSDNVLLFDKTIETLMNKPAFKLTRSCGNITDDLSTLNDNNTSKSNPLRLSTNKLKSNISFTKYITNTQTQTLSNENIILFNLNSNKTRNKTTNVNIINLNCGNSQFEYSSADESISDDSLDGNVSTNITSKYHTTPDLLNNHNAIENNIETTKQVRINYALQFGNIEYFETTTEDVFTCVKNLHYAWVTFEKDWEFPIINEIQSYRVDYCTAEVKSEHVPFESVQFFKANCMQNPVPVEEDIDNEEILSSIRSDDNLSEDCLNCCCNSNNQIDGQLFTASAMNFLSEATYYLSTLSENVSRKCTTCTFSTDVAIQTNITQDLTVQTNNSEFVLPVNKWEIPLEQSCVSLENKLRNIDEHKKRLERTYPKSRSPRPLSSPRAYLQELQSLRKQLIEESRGHTNLSIANSFST